MIDGRGSRLLDECRASNRRARREDAVLGALTLFVVIMAAAVGYLVLR